jgi:hypothetical protein
MPSILIDNDLIVKMDCCRSDGGGIGGEKYNIHAKKAAIYRSPGTVFAACVKARPGMAF